MYNPTDLLYTRVMDTSAAGHFTWPTGQFAYCLVISPTGHFAYWSFRSRDIWPTGQFAYWTVRLLYISPTAWTVRLQIALNFINQATEIK